MFDVASEEYPFKITQVSPDGSTIVIRIECPEHWGRNVLEALTILNSLGRQVQARLEEEARSKRVTALVEERRALFRQIRAAYDAYRRTLPHRKALAKVVEDPAFAQTRLTRQDFSAIISSTPPVLQVVDKGKW